MTNRRFVRGHQGVESACKRGSVPCLWRQAAAISLGRWLPSASSGCTRRLSGRTSPPPYSALLPMGFTLPATLLPLRCALTAPFHPCPHSAMPNRWRCVFCGTFRRVAPPGRYPASCPVEPRLSSPPRWVRQPPGWLGAQTHYITFACPRAATRSERSCQPCHRSTVGHPNRRH